MWILEAWTQPAHLALGLFGAGTLICGLAPTFGVLLGGTVTMEAVFTLNGVGTLILTSIRSKDIPVVIGAIVILAVCYTLVMLVVDILYGFIDPQIKARYLKR